MTTKYIEINPVRVNYQLSLYEFSEDNLLDILNESRKKKIERRDIFGKNITLSNLKNLDKIFDKSLSYYTSPQNPSPSPKSSILFRKKECNSKLTYPDRWRVNMIESELRYLSAITTLSDYKISRKLKKYTTQR